VVRFSDALNPVSLHQQTLEKNSGLAISSRSRVFLWQTNDACQEMSVMDWMNVRSPLIKIVAPVVCVLTAGPVWSDPLPTSHSAKDLDLAVAAQGLESGQGVGNREWGIGSGRLAVAPEQWAVGSEQWTEQWTVDNEKSAEIGLDAGATVPSQVEFLQSAESWKETLAQATETKPETKEEPKQEERDRSSPVLEKWQKQIPNVLQDIRRDPSFRTRIRLGLSYFPSTFDSLGWNVGVEDIFLFKWGATGLTVSGDYQALFTGARQAGGAELRYYVLPLGGYFNLAPVFGYRYLQTTRYVTSGLNVGFRVQAVLSRTGGADISLEQTWVAPQQSDEVGLTRLSFGLALTRNLRVSTDVDWQNSKQKKDNRYGISMEWMF
jgi:hypothetical protein